MRSPRRLIPRDRRSALESYGLLDSDTAPNFESITSLAAALCNVPICFVSVFEGDRIRFRSRYGWSVQELPAEGSFFSPAANATSIFEIEDALSDVRSANHELVAGPEHIRFYASAPLQADSGVSVGALCILDRQPRKLAPLERQALSGLARQVMVQLDYHRTASRFEAQNQDLRETARIARTGKWRFDLHSGELMWSDMVYSIFGIAPEEFSGDMESFYAAVHPSDQAAMREAQEHTLLGNRLDIEHRVCWPDRTVRWVHERGELIADSAGTPIYLAGTVQDITERKTLSRDLEMLFEISHDLICVIGADGLFLRVNPAFERTLGWTREELLAVPFEELLLAEDREKTKKELARLASSESEGRFENRLKTRDGRVRTFAWATAPIPEENYVYGIGRDITEEKELQKNVESFAERLSDTLESTTDAFLAVDRDWRFTFVNSRAEKLLQRDRSSLLSRNIWEEFPKPVDSAIYRQYHDAMYRQTPVHFEEFYAPLNKWFDVRAFPSPHGLGVYFRDITEQKKATEQLRLLETCVSYANDIVLVTEAWPLDEPGPPIVFVNDAFVRKSGYSREEVIGQTPRMLQGPKTAGPELQRLRSALVARKAVRVELINYTKRGDEFWLELDLVPVFDEKGICTHFVSIQRDITERKRIEEELRATAERYRLLFDSNPLPMWVYDSESLGFLAVNEAAILKYQYSKEEFLSLTIEDIRPPEDVPALRETIAVLGQEFSGLSTHRAKDGRLLTVEVHSHALVYAGRNARLVLPLDLTEKLRLEEQLQQAQKMETIGRLAGGIAHDFNNLLTVINGYAQLLLNRLPPEAADEDSQSNVLRHILRSGERAAELTAQLLAFSRNQVLQPQVVALNALLEGMKPLLRRLIREDIEIIWCFGEGTRPVSLDPSRFEQVMLNLALNARDAMPDGGTLTIETGNAHLDESYARVHTEVVPGDYAVIGVSDTGNGMSPETMRRVFDPFFTTKEKGSGTGLGLATVYGIVKQSGGHVNVYSEVGMGSLFKVYLPIVEGELTHVESEDRAVDDLTGAETVLLVEDDPGVRQYAAGILRHFGYQVVEASNGPEAIVEAEKFAGAIHLLLTDVVMPKLNGRDLAEFISARRPEIKVLFMSGYTENALVQGQGMLEQGLNFLPKPFSPAQLGRKVKSVLAAPKRAKTILILDDDADIRELFKDALESAGYRTVLCGDGKDAGAHLNQGPVDLLITDLVMPGQEGIETIRLVRKDFPHLKILAISGYGAGDYLKLARALGANDTLAKPVDIGVLAQKVKTMVGD